MRAVILAGGKGTRLKPYTSLIPKPLVPLGGKISIVELIIKQLKKNGFNHVTLAINNFSKLIESYLGNGKKYGIKIDYSFEKKMLGTFGPLTIIKDLPENFLVMNGDILTDLNFNKLMKSHIKQKNSLTLATFQRDVFIDFGTLKSKDNILVKFVEKPTFKFEVSTGIYCIKKNFLPKRKNYQNFDKFIIRNIKKKLNIYKHKGFWLDIGRVEDYQYADQNFKKILSKF